MENKEKNVEMGFSVVKTGTAIPEVTDKKTSQRWVSWGTDNKLPNYLYDNYLKNSNLQAVTNALLNFVVGDGIKADGISSEVLEKCILDYILFGGFTIECLRGRSGNIVQVNYVNVMNVRTNEDLDTAFLSSKWGNYSGKDIIELPLYNPNEKQNHFIYFYRGKLTRGINPIPMYIGCLKSIEILNGTRNFHLNNLGNNFNVSAIINLNNGTIKTRELDEIKRRLEENFTGTDNAGKFIIINNQDKEHAATIERLSADNFGDLYKSLETSSKDDIFTAFRINPMLVGINQQTGFQRQEFENAYALYYNSVVKPIQNDIAKVFGELGYAISYNPLIINWTE